MPWSKIVKRRLPENKEVKRYILEEVTPPAPPLPEEEPSSEPAGEISPEEREELKASKVEAEVEETLLSSAALETPSLSLYEQGHVSGFVEGEAKGFAEGQAKGFAEGEAKGFAEGEAKGFSEGEVKGFAEGEAKGFSEGEAKGFSEGQAKGFTDGELAGKKIHDEELREYEAIHQLLLRLVEDMKDFTETVIHESENDLLQIALSIAQKVLKKELSQDPEAILESIQEALSALSPAKTAILRIHPQDVEMITRKRPELLEAVKGVSILKIEPDPKLLPGDCIVETLNRIVDTRPEVQLAEIKKKLLSEG